MVEVGALAGFSGIVIARALGPGGHLHTIEFNPDYAEVARESFRKAGLEDRVTVHIGRASQVLEQLAELGPFDGIFIDADKDNYPVYLDWAEKNIRVGGGVFGDNTFGFGHVWRDPEDFEEQHLRSAISGLRSFNARLADNPNFRATILPTDQGLTMAVRIK
ncbi:Catechol O-methyltransferase [Frankliniella fusca]|nr:Catechol O-methyltransferase [Frankliniella fusca]